MNRRILIVDDDKGIVRILRGYLEDAGYIVTTKDEAVAFSNPLGSFPFNIWAELGTAHSCP
ncbi:MAG: hypothetical protein AAF702_09485 [Chloroflexota bacterium]